MYVIKQRAALCWRYVAKAIQLSGFRCNMYGSVPYNKEYYPFLIALKNT
jgi:hypothetical protein